MNELNESRPASERIKRTNRKDELNEERLNSLNRKFAARTRTPRVPPLHGDEFNELSPPCGACRRDARAEPCDACPLYGAWLERRGHAQGDAALRFLYGFWVARMDYWGHVWGENRDRQREQDEVAVAEIVRRFPTVAPQLARSAVTAMRRSR